MIGLQKLYFYFSCSRVQLREVRTTQAIAVSYYEILISLNPYLDLKMTDLQLNHCMKAFAKSCTLIDLATSVVGWTKDNRIDC